MKFQLNPAVFNDAHDRLQVVRCQLFEVLGSPVVLDKIQLEVRAKQLVDDYLWLAAFERGSGISEFQRYRFLFDLFRYDKPEVFGNFLNSLINLESAPLTAAKCRQVLSRLFPGSVVKVTGASKSAMDANLSRYLHMPPGKKNYPGGAKKITTASRTEKDDDDNGIKVETPLLNSDSEAASDRHDAVTDIDMDCRVTPSADTTDKYKATGHPTKMKAERSGISKRKKRVIATCLHLGLGAVAGGGVYYSRSHFSGGNDMSVAARNVTRATKVNPCLSNTTSHSSNIKVFENHLQNGMNKYTYLCETEV